ncbi:MAG TPA: FkbM family methyltransferase [Chitinophagaceae bacterium]|nr:FkbM family methyltransferase [Chitinophagaceae bacterium]
MNKANGGLRILVRFIKYFGIFHGSRLFLKIKSGRVSKMRIPGIVHPISLRKGTSDIAAFYQAFLNREYEIAFKETPKVIVDGGANIGLFTIIMKNRYPGAKIICIEPDPENFSQLLKNVSAYSNIHFENCGVWSKETRLKVYDKYKLGKWGVVVEESDSEESIFGISINSVMKKYSLPCIDILKLDIETSEKQVFAENFEEWLPKIRIVLIELHDWIEKGCSKAFFTAINRSFRDYFYSAKGENVLIINNDLE